MEPIVTTGHGQVRGTHRWWSPCVSGHLVRRAARRRLPAPTSAAGGAVERCARRHRSRSRATAAAVRPQRPQRHALRPRRSRRRLPQPERLDARPGSGRPSGDGVEPGRRLPLLLRRELRRQPLRPRRCGVRDDQLADGRRRVPLPRRRRRRRQPRPARPGRRAHLGAGQHQRLRRRSRPRHRVRRVRGRHVHRRPVGHAARRGSVPARGAAERRGAPRRPGRRRRPDRCAARRDCSVCGPRARRWPWFRWSVCSRRRR